MSKRQLTAIILGCTAVAIVAIVLIGSHLWRLPISPAMYSLSVDVSPSGAGSVSLSPSDGEYEVDAQVAMMATPASGYCFVNWTGDVGTVADVNSASVVITTCPLTDIKSYGKYEWTDGRPARSIINLLLIGRDYHH